MAKALWNGTMLTEAILLCLLYVAWSDVLCFLVHIYASLLIGRSGIAA